MLRNDSGRSALVCSDAMVLGHPPLDRPTLVLVESFLRHGRQRPRRFDPHQSHRVVEQRQQMLHLQLRRQRLQPPRRRTPQQWIGIGQQRTESLERRGIEPLAEQGYSAGAGDIGLVRISAATPAATPARRGRRERRRAALRRTVDGRQRACRTTFGPAPPPIGRLVAMTLRAGVGDAQRHRQVRAGNAEAVIVARVHDHVGRGGRVAGDAVRALGNPPGENGVAATRISPPGGIAGRPCRQRRAACRCAVRGSRCNSPPSPASCFAGRSRD